MINIKIIVIDTLVRKNFIINLENSKIINIIKTNNNTKTNNNIMMNFSIKWNLQI